jgi:hypothetical protein
MKEAGVMHCSKCGTQIPEDSRYCKSCGVQMAEKKSQPVRAHEDSPPKPLFTSRLWLRFMLAISKVVLIAGIIAAVAVGVAGDLGWGVSIVIVLLSVLFFILVESDVELVDRICHIDEKTRVAERNVRTIASIISTKGLDASSLKVKATDSEPPDVEINP